MRGSLQRNIAARLALLPAMALVIVVWRHRFDFGARPPTRWGSAWCAGLFLLVVVAVSVYPGVGSPSGARWANQGLAALFEELLFRGLMMGALLRYGAWPALIWSSVLFGAAHGQPALGEPSLANLGYVVYAGSIGFLLGAVRLHAGSIFLPLVIHAVINASGTANAAPLIEAWPPAVRVLTGALALAVGIWIMLPRMQGSSAPVVRLDQ